MKLILTPADRLAWAEYESLARRARIEYATNPCAQWARSNGRACLECGERTFFKDGICRLCKEAS